ncbi:MAG: transcription antitermination factor NusB [Candidatus Riflebacteria bacterium HGW-Riflebacteria-1]|nr:MAG: transcription antitermination factor NusB [Candidatus Riflebacteria bacterium HGW-Riflebacteria-1]
MVKTANEEALDQVLSSTLYQPVFEALARDFLKNTSNQKILSGGVEDFVPDFSDSLSAFPHRVAEDLTTQVKEILDRHFSGLTRMQQSDEELQDFYKKALDKQKKNFPIEEFARELVNCFSENHAKIDEVIEKTAQNWSIDRMAALDRCILRIAICELFHFKDIPANATINEAIELAKKYSAERSYEFVNGILDRICKENKLFKLETPAVRPKTIKSNQDIETS